MWPCDPARVEIAESYAGDRVGMATYMVMQLHLVAGEAAFVTPQELYERFVAWTRPGDPALVLAMWAHGPEARMS